MPELPLYEYGKVFKPPRNRKTGQSTFQAEIVRDGKALGSKEMNRREKWFEGMWTMFTCFGSPMGKMLLEIYKDDIRNNLESGSDIVDTGKMFGDAYLLDECIDCKLNFMVKPEGILIESWLESIPAYYLGVEFRNFLNDPKNH